MPQSYFTLKKLVFRTIKICMVISSHFHINFHYFDMAGHFTFVSAVIHIIYLESWFLFRFLFI